MPRAFTSSPEPVAELSAPEPPFRPELDTDADKRVQRLLSGIEEALQEAREILTLLGPKSP
jgi:hypothetical protein